MGFREDINMEDFVRSSDHLRDALGYAFGLPPIGMASDLKYKVSYGESSPDTPLYLTPLRTGSGPSTRSTCLQVERWPSIVWDVNGYYHALGVGFRATRKQLLRAYTQLNGQENAYLTYIFKQLLDEDVRREYDACPLGSVYIDQYVMETLKQRARDAAKYMSHLGHMVTPEEVLEDWGFKVVDEGDLPAEMDNAQVEDTSEVDTPKETGEDEHARQAEEPEEWPYSYYVWKLRHRENVPARNGRAMRLWQEAIVKAAQKRGVSIAFAVGVMGGQSESSRLMTMSVDGATVVFISTEATDVFGSIDGIDELAHTAIDRLTTSGI